jgi:uracil-DNA glycosylase family protein
MSQRSLFEEFEEPREEVGPAPELAAAEASLPEYGAAEAPPERLRDTPVLFRTSEATTPEEKAARLAEVREPALLCTKCPLSQTRTHVVFGEGNPAAPLVFVGEGPGENEDATGRPFVGRAGKLLDEVLRENGMTRQHVYICNVVKCRAANFEEGRWKNRPPRVEEVAACRDWLQAQLGIIRPIAIVCLGAPAANEIIHKGFQMTRERGRWFTTSPFAPWAMAAFHPAYVLRQHGPAHDSARAALSSDIANARRKVIEVRRVEKARGATG